MNTNETRRYCFRFQVRQDRIEEYKDYHRAVWPELLRDLEDAGWRNYSLFLSESGDVIGYFECSDMDAAAEKMAGSEANLRWQEAMAPLFAGDPGVGPGYVEVFNLRDQLDSTSRM